jgi:hypothetical protein
LEQVWVLVMAAVVVEFVVDGGQMFGWQGQVGLD